MSSTVDAYRAGRFYFHIGEPEKARPYLWQASLTKPWKIERWARWLVCLVPPVAAGIAGTRRRQWHQLWEQAHKLPGCETLQDSAIAEMAEYLKLGKEEALKVCQTASKDLADSWNKLNPQSPEEVTRFYQQENAYIGDLVNERARPFEFSGKHAVECLLFAREHGLKKSLDFGSGDGSCALFFAYHGLEAAAADVAPHLLKFVSWRFHKRNLTGNFYLLPEIKLPSQAFDMITAFDTFEHVAEPHEALKTVHAALKPGGYLIANLPFGPTCDHPMHLPHDRKEFMAFAKNLGFDIRPFTLKEFYVFHKVR